MGIDLSHVEGTGKDGRITREDLLSAVRAAASHSVDLVETGSQRDDYGRVRVEPLSSTRRFIAQQMHKSWSTVPRWT